MQTQSESAMANRQFWVIGNGVHGAAFHSLHGVPETEGPFASYDEAFDIWQARCNASRSQAHIRYTIAANPVR